MIEIRCSQLARPMTCAGSLFVTDLPEKEDSMPAKEGTAFGEYTQHLLECTPIPTHAKNGIPFDDDMKFYALPIAQDIIDRAQSEVLCEKRIDWATRSGIVIRGQPDASYTMGADLCVDDFKYGWGIVENSRTQPNWQLLGYAIGEVIRRQIHFEKIRLRIHQPRPHHKDGQVREWILTWDELLSYKEQIEARMDQIAAGDKTFVTSKQCKYCPAAGERCTALNDAFHRGIEVIHEFTQDRITDKELAFQLDLIARVTDVMKIKNDSLKELAISRLKQNRIIPGYSTERNLGDRSWKSGVSPAVIKAMTGKDIVKEQMLSPAQAEKLGVPKELVNALVDRHFTGMKLTKVDANETGSKIFGGVNGN